MGKMGPLSCWPKLSLTWPHHPSEEAYTSTRSPSAAKVPYLFKHRSTIFFRKCYPKWAIDLNPWSRPIIVNKASKVLRWRSCAHHKTNKRNYPARLQEMLHIQHSMALRMPVKQGWRFWQRRCACSLWHRLPDLVAELAVNNSPYIFKVLRFCRETWLNLFPNYNFIFLSELNIYSVDRITILHFLVSAMCKNRPTFAFDLFPSKYGKRALPTGACPTNHNSTCPDKSWFNKSILAPTTHTEQTLPMRSKVAFHAAVKSERKPKIPSAAISITFKINDHTKSKDSRH